MDVIKLVIEIVFIIIIVITITIAIQNFNTIQCRATQDDQIDSI